MSRVLFSRQGMLQALVLLITATVLGLIWNALWPKGVKIALRRPRPVAVEQGDEVRLAEITIASPGRGGAKHQGFSPGLRYVTLAQLDSLRLVPGALLVDARPAKSFAEGHIPGAVNLSVDEVSERREHFVRISGAPLVVVYCDDPRCDAAERLADELFASGCVSVAIYHDGLSGWRAAGRPVESSHTPGGESR